MKYKQIKVHWETEELDIHYRKNLHPEKVWKDNEGMPFGIYTIEIGEDDFESIIDAEWFCTKEERDFVFKKYQEWIKEDELKEKA